MTKPITEIAQGIGIDKERIILYGKYKAKIDLEALNDTRNHYTGKYIVVTAITPTPLGEGKTLNTIGLSMALNKIGRKSICTLRQPSMGPLFGIKGAGVGSGKSHLFPEDEINFHFTGDFHAITYAHNLITAVLYNSIYFGNPHNLKSVEWHRVLDLNDRSLRSISINMPRISEVVSSTRFDITPASEIMAILALSGSYEDLHRRISEIIVGFSAAGKPVFLKELEIQDAITGLLKDALMPNLVQTCEGTPAIVHTGPFGNIAHGSSSIVADYLGLKYCDYVITETGFGSECGYEKFISIKCRTSGLQPNLACILATLRGIKFQSGKFKKDDLQDKIYEVDTQAIEKGFPNLLYHINNIKKTGIPYLVLINKFPKDKTEELDYLIKLLRESHIYEYSIVDAFNLGSSGMTDAAYKVTELAQSQPTMKFPYQLNESIEEKFSKLCKNFYNSENAVIDENARLKINSIRENNLENLPLCVAKTQLSISCNPKAYGLPKNEPSVARDVRIFNGAGFIVVVTENIETMPGLPREPLIKRYKFDFKKKLLSFE